MPKETVWRGLRCSVLFLSHLPLFPFIASSRCFILLFIGVELMISDYVALPPHVACPESRRVTDFAIPTHPLMLRGVIPACRLIFNKFHTWHIIVIACLHLFLEVVTDLDGLGFSGGLCRDPLCLQHFHHWINRNAQGICASWRRSRGAGDSEQVRA